MIASVTDVSPLVRCVRLEHASLAGVDCTPGDKLQVFLANAGTRTYTPVGWDASRGAFELVVYLRPGAASPGVEWARALAPGQGVRFFGPRKSVRAAREAPGVVLFGDETSLGVARALGASRPDVRFVLEVSDPGAVERVTGDRSERVVLVPRDGERHYDAVVNAICAGFGSGAQPELLLTGAAPSIQAVQKRLKAAGIRASSSKAYWAPGKVGLD
jgi:NADPH-dependent ferric siderophore reductase